MEEFRANRGGFFSALGFFASRFCRPLPFAELDLPVAHVFVGQHSSAYGVFLSALCVIARPVAEMSWPAPAVVWQAPSKGAAPISKRSVRAIEKFLRMEMVPSVVVQSHGLAQRQATNSASPDQCR